MRPRLPHLASVTVAALSLVALACGSAPSKETASEMDAGPTTTPASSTHPGPTGTGCTAITQTYSVCETVSLCPGVRIDQTAFPGCGFSIHGDVIDPECLCFGSMCAMGAPVTCADMAALLSSGMTIGDVCDEFTGGHCANQGGQWTPSACSLCKSNCDGNLACLQNCGC